MKTGIRAEVLNLDGDAALGSKPKPSRTRPSRCRAPQDHILDHILDDILVFIPVFCFS